MTTTFDLDLLGPALAEHLPGWLPGQRWFGGKGRTVEAVRLRSARVLLDGDPSLVQVLVDVEQDGHAHVYQLLLGSRIAHVPDVAAAAHIGDVGGVAVYEASGDHELAGALLLAITPEPGVVLQTGLRGRALTVEQSNTSLVYGSQYILKLFRRVSPGPNRDVELHRALTSVGCEHVAQVLGVLEGELENEAVTLGLLQPFLADAVDGWTMATTSVRDLMADPAMAPEESGGDFAGESGRLGRAVATVHADLARALGTVEADADALAGAARAMTGRLDRVTRSVPELEPYRDAAAEVFARVARTSPPVRVQQVHGDLHLGQSLRTVAGWLLLDFEGEPAAPPDERALLRSPLRDVAGMLRSFDYAAHQMLVGVGADADPLVHERATQWADRNRDAFCVGYAEVAGTDPRAADDLLHALELDKAVYEVAYEQANRPGWLPVPLAAVARLTGVEA